MKVLEFIDMSFLQIEASMFRIVLILILCLLGLSYNLFKCQYNLNDWQHRQLVLESISVSSFCVAISFLLLFAKYHQYFY